MNGVCCLVRCIPSLNEEQTVTLFSLLIFFTDSDRSTYLRLLSANLEDAGGRVLACLEGNPVRAGLVGRLEKYRWSIAAVHLGLAKDLYSVLDNEFWMELGGAEACADVPATPEEALEMRLLRRCTYAGRLFGEQQSVAMFKEQFGREWRKWGFAEEGRGRTFAG